MKDIAAAPGAHRLLIDCLIMGFLALLLGMAVGFPSRVNDPGLITCKILIAMGVYLLVGLAVRRNRNAGHALLLQTVGVLAISSYLFGQSMAFQQFFYGRWFDAQVVRFESSIVGVEASVYSQQFVNPLLTEWLMFSYVIYIPLLPLVVLICYRRGGAVPAYDYLLSLLAVYLICYSGFILFPVAGPMEYYPDRFHTPLAGGPFAFLGNWLRDHVHAKGGCLPSPHCAAATVMLAMAIKHSRRLAFILAPVVVSLYVSTVYGRFHYASDSFAGIAAALVVVLVEPALVRRVRRILHSRSIVGVTDSLPESAAP
jgi:membrane-associated phospholipid phosphatase